MRERGTILLALLFVLLAPAAESAAKADPETAKRFEAWQKDLSYLHGEIGKPQSLREILRVKGIEWKKVRAEADRRFAALRKTAFARKKPDEQADCVGYYEVLLYVIRQLRDSHAYVRVDKAVSDAWRAAQPKTFPAGIELQPGAFGEILVANVRPGRGCNSPLMGLGVTHTGTVLLSVNRTPAPKYFEAKAKKRLTEEGGESTYGRAFIEALYDLEIPEGGSIDLVFKEIDLPEAARKQYAALAPKNRKSAYRKLQWKTKKVTLRASQCTRTRNPRNFSFRNVTRPELTAASDRGVWYGRLPSGHGYVRYTGVSGGSKAALTQALQALADCPGLVLDVRLNSGGGGSGVAVFDREAGVWKKPVAVLIGPKAMSAAETELWSLRAMRDRKQLDARFFGRTTAGASGKKFKFKLPSGFAAGQFVYRHWHGGTSKVEGAGIEPDEPVDQDVVELSLGIDSVVVAAERWLDTKAGKRR